MTQTTSSFYSYPRFVTHVDEGFIQQLTDLYRDRLKPNTRIFDEQLGIPSTRNGICPWGHGLALRGNTG